MYCIRVFCPIRVYNELKHDTSDRVHDNAKSFISNVISVKRKALMLEIHVLEAEIIRLVEGFVHSKGRDLCSKTRLEMLPYWTACR